MFKSLTELPSLHRIMSLSCQFKDLIVSKTCYFLKDHSQDLHKIYYACKLFNICENDSPLTDYKYAFNVATAPEKLISP